MPLASGPQPQEPRRLIVRAICVSISFYELVLPESVQVHGANGYSDEDPVGGTIATARGAVIYEGTREIHKVMQADCLRGYRVDRPTRCELPPDGAKTSAQKD